MPNHYHSPFSQTRTSAGPPPAARGAGPKGSAPHKVVGYTAAAPTKGVGWPKAGAKTVKVYADKAGMP